jgi:hypothetical protein
MHGASSGKAPNRHCHAVLVVLAAIGCAVAIAACGSSGKSSNAAGTVGSSGPIKFADCMRSHGVPNFPDPRPNSGVDLGPGSGINQQSPAFQSAQRACGEPGSTGGTLLPVSESEKLAQIAASRCMREHGVPNYPDPTFCACRPRVSVALPPGINPQSPAFQRAQKICGP